MEVVGTNLAGHQLHALCLGRRIRLHAQLVNTGHSLHGEAKAGPICLLAGFCATVASRCTLSTVFAMAWL